MILGLGAVTLDRLVRMNPQNWSPRIAKLSLAARCDFSDTAAGILA